MELLEQEAAIAQALDHPQLPKFRELYFGSGEDRDRIFWVQDYIPGQTLQTLIEARWLQQRQFSEAEGVQLLQRLLPVLDYLHSCGTIHRNLSPANIVLNSSERSPALLDLGGVKQAMLTLESEFPQPDAASAAVATAPHLGEPGYAPPEQLTKGIVYTYSDLYALAMTVLVMITGESPEQLADFAARHSRHRTELLAILARALAVQPSDRYQTATEFLQAVEGARLLAASSSPAQHLAIPPATGGRPRAIGRFACQTIVTLSFIVAAGALGWWLGNLWLGQQLPMPEVITVPDLDRAARLPPAAETPPEPLNFPAANDPEPEPMATLSPSERQRQLELRDRRRALAVDYEIYHQLTDQLYWAQYPEQNDDRPSADASQAALRAAYDETARQLLTQLSRLSAEARSRLGRYRAADRDSWQRQVQAFGLPAPAFEAMVTATFEQWFPEQRGLASDKLVEQPLGQIWQAIARDTLTALQAGKTQTTLVLPEGRNTLQTDGTLATGTSQVFSAVLGHNQWLALTVLTNELPLQLAIYAPDGRRLNQNPDERAWSGALPLAGRYAIVITSQSAQTLDYQLNFTVKNP
ncbi:MAG: protein kinase [Spirulinaceae cyanobacterium SM2_1_0]|nr:protein kinase [Spirulinaceae cyanobacterium SM2_1_0]